MDRMPKLRPSSNHFPPDTFYPSVYLVDRLLKASWFVDQQQVVVKSTPLESGDLDLRIVAVPREVVDRGTDLIDDVAFMINSVIPLLPLDHV